MSLELLGIVVAYFNEKPFHMAGNQIPRRFVWFITIYKVWGSWLQFVYLTHLTYIIHSRHIKANLFTRGIFIFAMIKIHNNIIYILKYKEKLKRKIPKQYLSTKTIRDDNILVAISLKEGYRRRSFQFEGMHLIFIFILIVTYTLAQS